jgi:phospho-N-acetylmuramoyl-pentapeptide-transferase
MLLILIHWLKSLGIHIPAVFSYFSTRMIFAALTSLIITICFGKQFIKKLYDFKMGEMKRYKDDCPYLDKLHIDKNNTPTMGGILILFSMLISLILWMDLSNIFTWIFILASIWLGFTGVVDDYLKLKYKDAKGLKAKKKLILQLIFACSLAFYLNSASIQTFVEQKTSLKPPTAKEYIANKDTYTAKQMYSKIYFPFFKEPIFSLKEGFTIFSFLIMVFVIIASSNAVNLTDGLDGLAAGCLIMVSMSMALFAFLSNHVNFSKYLNILYIEGSGEIAIYLVALAGACLGFLWYNGYPAQIFMGDTGSISLGGIIGVSAILIRREFLLAIVGMVFVIETLSVIIQVLSYKYRNKKRVFLCAPLHHHFEYKGWPETKVVLRFWIIGLFWAIIGIASIKFQ